MSDDHATAAALPADPRPGTRPLADTALGVLGIELVSCSASQVVARMPVEATFANAGLLLVLAESVASTAAGIAAGHGRRAFGAELNASFVTRPSAGTAVAIASPLELGTDLHVWAIEVRDSRGERALEARCTLGIVASPA